MKRILAGLVAAAIGAFALTGAGGAVSANAQANSVKVNAGNGEPGYAVNAFLPDSITITTGTTVSWQFPWIEPHTITFGTVTATTKPSPSPATYDGTGVLTSDLTFGNPNGSVPPFEVKFTKAGSFKYSCEIHPFMTGTVTVVNSGNVDSQSTIDQRRTNNYVNRLGELKTIAAGLGAQGVSVTPMASGGNKYTLNIGPATRAGDDVMQFIPGAAKITAGDTVEWKALAPTPHTVTFGPLNPPPGPGFDPFAVPPSKPAAGYDGTGFVNSGIMTASPPGAPADPNEIKSFELKFTKAGTYQYYCILHADQAMVGQIMVEAAPPPPTRAPGPPNPGTGTESGATSWMLLAGVVLVAVVLGGGSVLAVRREGTR